MAQVPAATRTLRVLRYLASQPDPVPLDAIARACELPRSSAYHLVTRHGRRGVRRAPGRRAPLRARGGGVRGGQRVRATGSAAADRPAPAGRAGRPDPPERAPGGAARQRRPVRPRGAGARPAAAGHRRRRPAPRAPDRERPGGARAPVGGAGAGALPLVGRLRGAARHRTDLAELAAVAADRDPAARVRRRDRRGDARAVQRRRCGARPQRPPTGGGRGDLRRGRRRARDARDRRTPDGRAAQHPAGRRR